RRDPGRLLQQGRGRPEPRAPGPLARLLHLSGALERRMGRDSRPRSGARRPALLARTATGDARLPDPRRKGLRRPPRPDVRRQRAPPRAGDRHLERGLLRVGRGDLRGPDTRSLRPLLRERGDGRDAVPERREPALPPAVPGGVLARPAPLKSSTVIAQRSWSRHRPRTLR